MRFSGNCRAQRVIRGPKDTTCSIAGMGLGCTPVFTGVDARVDVPFGLGLGWPPMESVACNVGIRTISVSRGPGANRSDDVRADCDSDLATGKSAVVVAAGVQPIGEVVAVGSSFARRLYRLSRGAE